MDASVNKLPGLHIRTVTEAEFKSFARQHGTSPEIGRIGTHFDDSEGKKETAVLRLLGLFSCGEPCGITCCTLQRASTDQPFGGKLDSVIVDDRLRRRGIASLLVAKAFLDLIEHAGSDISTLYAYAVHPGTVCLLRRLSFGDPPPVGAPLASLKLDDSNMVEVIANFAKQVNSVTGRLKFQCALCLKGNRRAQPWCVTKPLLNVDNTSAVSNSEALAGQ